MLSIKNKIKSSSEALLLGFDNFTGLRVSGSDINSPAISARISAGEPLNIAGHSHGGHVVKEYSNLPSAVKIDKLVTLGTPQRESYHINRSMVGSYINAY